MSQGVLSLGSPISAIEVIGRRMVESIRNLGQVIGRVVSVLCGTWQRSIEFREPAALIVGVIEVALPRQRGQGAVVVQIIRISDRLRVRALDPREPVAD